MCVIIYRKPGVTIPQQKLESACLVNPDGMGLIAIDRGKLVLRKYFDKKGNNPEHLAKFFEDTKDLTVYAHLRFRTRGATDIENVHPFSVLSKKKHGVDVQFMHNGTISGFGNEKSCDSKVFAKEILTPLLERTFYDVGDQKLLHDPLVRTILEKYAMKNSVFLLADNFGNHRIINYEEGKDFGGWWASNEYSFNRFHRSPNYSSSYHNASTYKADEWKKDEYWKKDSLQDDKKAVTVPFVPIGSTSPVGGPNTKVIYDSEGKIVGGVVGRPFDDEVPFNTEAQNDSKPKEVATKPNTTPTLPKRERFIDVAQLSNLAEVVNLSSDDIKDLIDDYPEEAYMLIRDLIKELYDRDAELDDMADAEEALRSVA